MTREQVLNLAETLLVPIVTAVLGVLGIAFGDWRLRRTQAGRRKLALDDASKQVTFTANWWNARKLISDSPETMQEATAQAASWLEEASALVMGSTLPPNEKEQSKTLRRLLLLYPLKVRAANIIRVVFYAWIGLLVGAAGNLVSVAPNRKERSQYLRGDSLVVVVIAVVALGLRLWAGVAEAQGSKGRQEPRLTPRRTLILLRRSLLLYRFQRRSASIVRIIFYVSLLVVLLLAVSVIDEWGTPWVAADLSYVIWAIGYAVGLRYWADSLEVKYNGTG